MIVVEFYFQFLFVVNSSLRHTGQEKKKKWSAQKNLDCQELTSPPPVLTVLLKTVRFWQSKEMTPRFLGGHSLAP